jgi:hypothetical protein
MGHNQSHSTARSAQCRREGTANNREDDNRPGLNRADDRISSAKLVAEILVAVASILPVVPNVK